MPNDTDPTKLAAELDRWKAEADHWETLGYWPANSELGPKASSGLWHDCSWVRRCSKLLAERTRLRDENARLVAANESWHRRVTNADDYKALADENARLRRQVYSYRETHGCERRDVCALCLEVDSDALAQPDLETTK